jgi:RHS repeat-associated protein
VLFWRTAQAEALRQLDDLGRVVAIRQPGQGWSYAAHDAAGHITLMTDPRGAQQRLRRDSAGRVLQIDYFAPGESRPQQLLERRYEGERLVEASVSDEHGIRRTRWTHDARGAVLSETLAIEPAGELSAALAQPLSFSLHYRYSPAGDLLAREIGDATGRRLTLEQGLDAQARVQSIVAQGVLPRWLGGGRAALRAVEWQGWGSLDYATRIAHADGSFDLYEPLPDAAAAASGAVPASSAAVPKASSPQRIAPPGLRHDAAGLPASVHTQQGLQGLSWNAAGQLSQTRRNDGRSLYLYDAMGRRVATLAFDAWGAPTLRLALYEDHRLVAEADDQGRFTHAYVHLGHRPVAQLLWPDGGLWAALRTWMFGPDVRPLHTARAGRVLSMSEAGQIIWRDNEAKVGAAPEHQPLRYVGQYHDEDSGLDYHGARFFDPGTGRFISPDPMGVTDAIDGLALSRLLDLYAYAGGQPDGYFDPDGAARIRYFAITSNSQGKPMGSTQGFVKARWAFIVDEVASGGDSSALGQKRNAYATAGTSLLVDVAGNYFKDKGQSAETWSGPEATTQQDFLKHYGDKLISIGQFTIDDMNDDDATRLIASYIDADRQQMFGGGCPLRAALLPPIRFASGEADIHVDRQVEPPFNGSQANQANAQKILNCKRPTAMPIEYANDDERRRIAKYEAAAELQESPPTSAIYKDCSSNNGCRSGTAITVNGNRYYASYGRTQFVVETFLATLEKLAGGLTSQQRKQLRLDQKVTLLNGSAGTMLDLLSLARTKATAAAKEFSRLRDPQKGFGPNLTSQQALAAWDALTAARQESFRLSTGMGRQEFVDMLSFVPEGRARTNAEATNAFGSEAAMRVLDGHGKAIFGDWLLWLYSSQDQYNFVSSMFLKANLSLVMGAPGLDGRFVNAEVARSSAYVKRQRAIERELAQRVAALHNWGNVARVTANPMRLLPWVQAYVDEFVSTAGRGDFMSLRCSDELGVLSGVRMQTLSMK